MESLVLAHGNGADEIGLLAVVIVGIVLAFVLAERSSRRAYRERPVDPGSDRSASAPVGHAED